MDTLRKTFKFGAWHDIRNGPKQYGGVTIVQTPDFGFEVSMHRYLRDHGKLIRIEKGSKGPRKPEEDATPGEITGMRGTIGVMNWSP